MVNNTHIGRLGALAVALGIGSAIASTACIANADSSDASASGGSAASKSDGAARSAGSSKSPSASRSRPSGINRGPAATTARDRSEVKLSKPQRNSDGLDQVSGADTGSEAEAPVTAPVTAPVASAVRVQVAHLSPARVAAPQAAINVGRLNAVVQELRTAIGAFLNSLNSDTPPPGPLLWSVIAFARDEFDRVVNILKTGSPVVASNVLATSPNLLVNPGAEFGDASGLGNGVVTVPGWTVTGNPTVIQYGTLKNSWPTGLSFQMPNLPAIFGYPGTNQAPPDGGDQFFGGGNVTSSNFTQTVDLSAVGEEIDHDAVQFNLSGYLGGYLLDPSYATVQVQFLDENKLFLGSADLSPVTNLNRWGLTGFKQRETTGTIPVGTRSAVVTLSMNDLNPVYFGFTARYNNAYADNLSFTIDADLPAPPDPTPPASIVGELDHVFLVYMENKGYDSIVGSPNAPFLNSLINGYGFANNYYAITHPSLPNYYAMVGGTDFGKTYNCPDVCIDDPDALVFNIDNAGKTWRGYAQSMTPGQPLVSQGDYSTDQLPFPAFAGIGDNQEYAEAHLFPLDQMAVDFESAETTPNFVWFAANESFNGEGPVDGLSGILHFLAGQLNPKHQYNVPALDQFLSETVPVVMNSAVWNDPTLKSALIVTFDEDNNNITLGIGNEGNHIVTVVIPSPGAVALGGMRDGAFIVTDRLDHFSTLRTIEEALGLPTMTNNDKYALPLNAFWT